MGESLGPGENISTRLYKAAGPGGGARSTQTSRKTLICCVKWLGRGEDGGWETRSWLRQSSLEEWLCLVSPAGDRNLSYERSA